MRRVSFFIIIFFLTIVGVPLGIIWPSIKQIRSTSQDIYREYEFLEERSQRGQNIRRAKKDYENASPHLTEIKSLTIEQNKELDFVASIESLADLNGVNQIINLDVDSKTSLDSYYKVPLELIIHGSYRDIVKYIAALRTMPTVISLTSLSLSGGQTADALIINRPGAGTKIEARMTGVVYERLSK